MTRDPLISTGELAARLDQADLRLVDASWHLDGREPRPDFEAGRLPGAALFDLEASSDPDSELPHMLPSAARFGERMGRLGLSETNPIVVYDTLGVRSSPRAWWMLTAMGASNVRVLDGGLPKWRDEGRPMEKGSAPAPIPARFQARLDPQAVADLDAVRMALAAGDQVIDARSAGRFRGAAPEPRAGLRSGHMPGARNLPFPMVLAADGRMKSPAELKAAFVSTGVDLDRPVITSCGSGVTAAILSLALARLGRDSRVYDGSWAEWGGRPDTPVATG